MTPPEGTVDDDLDQRLGELMDNARGNDLLDQAEEARAETEPPEPFATDAAERAEADATTGEPETAPPAETSASTVFDPFALAPEAPAEADDQDATPDLAAEGATDIAEAELV